MTSTDLLTETPERAGLSPVFQFVYVSSAIVLFTDHDLQGLLEVSRRRNAESGLTGLLLYVNGNFIQLLEGEKEAVFATRDRIASDSRHRGMIVLLEDFSEKRDFPDWSMGFEALDPMAAADLPGLSDFLRGKVGAEVRNSSALRLLEFFRDLNLNKKRP
jgi:hypothetical protein